MSIKDIRNLPGLPYWVAAAAFAGAGAARDCAVGLGVVWYGRLEEANAITLRVCARVVG